MGILLSKSYLRLKTMLSAILHSLYKSSNLYLAFAMRTLPIEDWYNLLSGLIITDSAII